MRNQVSMSCLEDSARPTRLSVNAESPAKVRVLKTLRVTAFVAFQNQPVALTAHPHRPGVVRIGLVSGAILEARRRRLGRLLAASVLVTGLPHRHSPVLMCVSGDLANRADGAHLRALPLDSELPLLHRPHPLAVGKVEL